MKIRNPELEKYRRAHPTLGPGKGMFGFFVIPTGRGGRERLAVISSGPAEGSRLDDPLSWEHVSVSLEKRTPTWDEMARVKALFWSDDECVIQFHPPRSQYKNDHKHCLHLWKPPYATPTPPIHAV